MNDYYPYNNEHEWKLYGRFELPVKYLFFNYRVIYFDKILTTMITKDIMKYRGFIMPKKLKIFFREKWMIILLISIIIILILFYFRLSKLLQIYGIVIVIIGVYMEPDYSFIIKEGFEEYKKAFKSSKDVIIEPFKATIETTAKAYLIVSRSKIDSSLPTEKKINIMEERIRENHEKAQENRNEISKSSDRISNLNQEIEKIAKEVDNIEENMDEKLSDLENKLSNEKGKEHLVQLIGAISIIIGIGIA